MQTERKEIYSIRREFGWLFLVAGVAGIVFMGVLLFRQRRYNLISAVITLFACLPFYFAYEKREGSIRRMVMLAVMTAMTVTGRCVFAPVPYFKPTISIVILSGLYMGPEAGFLVGSLSAVISNIFFGQGPWTPFQMLTWGIIAMIPGLPIFRKTLRHRIPLVLYGIFLADGYLDGDQLVWILYLGGLPGSADLCDSGCCGILYLECYISDDSVKADRRKTGTDSDQTWDFLIKEWGRT